MKFVSFLLSWLLLTQFNLLSQRFPESGTVPHFHFWKPQKRDCPSTSGTVGRYVTVQKGKHCSRPLRRVRVTAPARLILKWFITPLHDSTDPWKAYCKALLVFSLRVNGELYNWHNSHIKDYFAGQKSWCVLHRSWRFWITIAKLLTGAPTGTSFWNPCTHKTYWVYPL